MREKGQENQAASMTKRELLTALSVLVEDWNGIDAIDRRHARKFIRLMDALDSPYLSPSECHALRWHEMWLAEARRKPHEGLREQWLDALKSWRSRCGETAPSSDAQY